MALKPWPAPGKLNLFLHILGRRGDGYHELETVFQFIDLGDTLFFRKRSDGRIRPLYRLPGVPPEGDLVLKAARLLQRASSTPWGADIGLVKRLPMGAGLGGGSSDAATTLVALNEIWELGWDRAALARLGLTLGADVPVFVEGKAAFARGVGEKLTPIALPEPFYGIVVPPCPVSTAEIFADPALTRNTPPLKIERFQTGMGRNDCQSVVCRLYPQVAEALAWLSGHTDARLTGTGGAVFGPFPSREEGERVMSRCPWKGYVVRGMNLSPLYHG
ncbi:MAG: 4-(cytidine 5'-diphospho)-2-C-methyl-D-erythritol kinase [Gammaproteobacteria bacterium]|nr:MAG: 4-(cytidine 5'-diphospho)-2-C-methyl-D-erythritol kinase [Gammaproteobacteria bacterium]